MKKQISILMVMMMIVSPLAALPLAVGGESWLIDAPLFSGAGSGTPGVPYQITNVSQLQELELDLVAHYKLINDIDASATSGAASGDLVALGKEQWELQECYNCHKLFGSGGKKRGPVLDNIGNLMTSEQLREKLLYPKKWKAEGFDKQYKKGKMPDKYRDLMFDEEVDALIAFLSTLKDASVNTPKPIKMY